MRSQAALVSMLCTSIVAVVVSILVVVVRKACGIVVFLDGLILMIGGQVFVCICAQAVHCVMNAFFLKPTAGSFCFCGVATCSLPSDQHRV